MSYLQQLVVVGYGLFALIGFGYGLYQVRRKNNPLGGTGIFNLVGAFVWADAIVFGFFWFIGSTLIYLTGDWILFLLGQSLFWVIRSLGETIYWFNQQFSQVNRNPIRKQWLFNLFKDEYTTWFVYQISWQCITVVAILASLYFGKLWLD